MRGIVLQLGAVCLATAVHFQELPGQEDLLARVDLPGFWEVVEFRIVAQATVGTPIEPRAQLRFEIDASPTADLYVASGNDTLGPFTTVIASLGDEAVRTLYGTMDLKYSAGSWDGPVTVENPVDALGVPEDSFLTPTLVLGSDRQVQVADALRSASAAELQIALEQDRQRLMQENARALDDLMAAHLAQRSQVQQELDAERVRLEELRQGVESEIAGIAVQVAQRAEQGAAELDERLSLKKAQLDEEAAAVEAAQEIRLRNLKAAQSTELGETVASHLEEIQTLELKHAEVIGTLKAEQEREMAELTAKLSSRKESLEQQLAVADEVLALQASLTARQTAIRVNDESIRAAEQERQVQFGQSLDGLKGNWTGLALCRYNNTDRSYTVSLALDTVAGRSVQGKMSNPTWQTRAATVHLLGNDLTLPLPLKVVIGHGDVIGTNTLDMQLQADGWLIGQSPDEVCKEVRLSKG